jgi:hypothetical protein
MIDTKGLPSAERMEKMDELSRHEWRKVMAASFLINLTTEDLIQIVSEGKGVWLQFARQTRQRHAMREDDMIWIFNQFRIHLKERQKVVEEVLRGASRPTVSLSLPGHTALTGFRG